MINKPTPTCSLKSCKKDSCSNGKGGWGRFCNIHIRKVTINGFLLRSYALMKSRVSGGSTKRPDLYRGLSILPKEVFISWAKNHSDFLSLYKQYVTSNFDRKLAPSVNRMNSNKGYVLGNIEWMTNSQNCGLAGTVKKMKNIEKKMIYQILGVK